MPRRNSTVEIKDGKVVFSKEVLRTLEMRKIVFGLINTLSI